MGASAQRVVMPVLALLSLTACSGGEIMLGSNDADVEDDTSVPDAADADADADVDADVDVDADSPGEAEAESGADDGGEFPGTLSVLVLGSPLLEGTEWPKLEGAAVAFDVPGGGRIERRTDATGYVSFDGFFWFAGPGAVTAWAPGHGLASLVGLDGGEAEVTLVLPSLGDPRPGWTSLGISAVNMSDVAHVVEVGAVGTGTSFHNGTGTSMPFLLSVPPSTPLVLEAYEFIYTMTADGFDMEQFAWIFQEQAPVTGPTAVELDFARAVATTAVSGSFAVRRPASMPTFTPSAFASVYPLLAPCPAGSPYLWRVPMPIGLPTRMHTTTDGTRAEYELRYTAGPPGMTSPVTRYVLRSTHDLYYLREYTPVSVVDVPGLPTAGAQTFGFLDVAAVDDPAATHPLYEPISWELFDTGVTPSLYVKYTGGALNGVDIWWITAPTDATTLTVPEPPVAVDIDEVLGTDIMSAVIGLRADDPGVGVQDRYSESSYFVVQP